MVVNKVDRQHYGPITILGNVEFYRNSINPSPVKSNIYNTAQHHNEGFKAQSKIL